MTTPPPPPGHDPTAPPPPGPDPYQPWASPPQDPYQQPPQAYPQPPPYQVPSSPPYQVPSSPPYQVPSSPPYQVSGGGQPYSPYPQAYPGAPMGYGFDPVTGRPYSDKSKVVAGLLQLLPGFLASIGGIGRLYAGHIALGVTHLGLSVFGWLCLCCGFAFLIPTVGLSFAVYVISIPILAGTWLWAVVDGIVLLAGRSTDGQGRPLRP